MDLVECLKVVTVLPINNGLKIKEVVYILPSSDMFGEMNGELFLYGEPLSSFSLKLELNPFSLHPYSKLFKTSFLYEKRHKLGSLKSKKLLDQFLESNPRTLEILSLIHKTKLISNYRTFTREG